MRYPFFRSSRPLVFAHRGGAALAPENTLEAFDTGLACGADGLELDVHLTRDGLVAVHHDATLERTTSLRGPVAARDAAELARADAAYAFRREDGFPFRGRDIGVPTLADVLRRYRDVPIIVELKVNSTALARAVLDTIRAADAIDRICLSSFHRRVLHAVRRLEPAVATGAAREEVRWALYRSRWGWPVRQVPYGGFQVPEWAGRTRVVSPRFLAAAHQSDLSVQVWTVDRPDDARRLLGWGVDALITDRPDLISPLVRDPDGFRARRPGF
jgi:glycerophosphoryl diester phosphodiesterase